MSIVGTRPEAIKTAPIAIEAATRQSLSHRIIVTGQQEALADEALAEFDLVADVRLPPVLHAPSPDIMTQRFADALSPIVAHERPDLLLVQGDTTSAYAGAIAAHRLGIPIAHVEAGLRSGDLDNPWPEERNRIAIDRLSTLLFAPTGRAAGNLRRDHDVSGEIHVTGNTGIDALLAMRARLPATPRVRAGDPALILLTCHRRESFGAGIERICAAALRIADRGDVRILCPVHSNPAVDQTVRTRLSDHPAILLTGALGYRETVAAMASARLILTDSGGIQEEAPALGTPTLVLRDVTERSEAIATGNLTLVGTEPDRIVTAASRLLDNPAAHAAMARPAFPFGDGRAATKILDHLEHYFSGCRIGDRSLPFTPFRTMDAARQGA